jgi:hypothetical protein
MLTVKGSLGRETPKRSYSSRNRTPLDALQKGEPFIESSNINGRLNLTSLTVVKNFLPSPNLEERFFGLAEHGAKRSALPDRSTQGAPVQHTGSIHIGRCIARSSRHVPQFWRRRTDTLRFSVRL